MKTRAAMDTLIWLAFLEIMLVLFSQFDRMINLAVHAPLGLAVLGFAIHIYRSPSDFLPSEDQENHSNHAVLAIFQGLLGVILSIGTAMSLGSLYMTVISSLHVGTALAMITQASSSPTAFDMWEEKEFQPVQPP